VSEIHPHDQRLPRRSSFSGRTLYIRRISLIDSDYQVDSEVISSYRIYASLLSAMMWGKLGEMFAIVASPS